MSEPNAEKQVGLSLGLRGKSRDGMTLMAPLLVDGDVVGMVECGRADILDLVESRLTDRRRAEVERELERWRSGQRRKGLPTIESVPDGIQYAAALARAIGTEGGEDHDRLLAEAGQRLKGMHDAAATLLAEAVVRRGELTALRDLRDAVRVLRRHHDRFRDANPLTYEGEGDLAPLFRELDVVDALGDDLSLGALGDLKVQFWMCPDGHSERAVEEPLRQTVEWRENVAYCLEPGCTRSSAKPVTEADRG